jgi:hypothetical protein
LAYVNRGLLRLLEGKADEAEGDFERALDNSGGARRSIEEQISRIKRFVAVHK